MEKLIELLNEYNIELHGVDRAYKDGFDLAYEQEYMRDFRVAYLISKKFGFIKWLILNDKINFYKLEDDSSWYNIDTGIDYLDMLALLSIQDDPVEFLIGILK